jgi:hypothetical protein
MCVCHDVCVCVCVFACSAVINAFLMPLFGYISDTHSTRFGRRRPFMVIGVGGMCIGFLRTCRGVSAVRRRVTMPRCCSDGFQHVG